MKKKFKDKEIKKIIVIIYINNFFCFVCVDKLINILESNVYVRLKLYVVSLYYIMWRFCDEEYYNEYVLSD